MGRDLRRAQQRPVFDMVSGVSTGALIAPLAFVGSDESYERAFVTYQNPKKDWFVGRGLMNFLFRRESYVDNKGLREETARQVDCTMLDAITAGAAEDRCLLIGTTNLDQGMLKMWDLTAMARGGCADETVQKRIYDVIMASASIPAAFPPVEIDGDLYADGAVTRNIAYTTDQDSELSAVQMWHKKYPGRKIPHVRIWVIINNQLGTPARSVGAPWPEQVKRALEISSRANTIASLKSLSLAVQEGRYDNVEGVEFRFIAIPDDWRPPVEGLFQKETMQSLAQLGYGLGKDLANWKTRVPDPESPSRVEP
ncbi:MAG: patatin-like phospholipase family protein [Phycisphaerales bacterium]